MVKAAGTASGPSALRPLNLPKPVQVEAQSSWPVAVIERGARHEVASVEDVWRISEEWWRDAPIERTYFEVLLDSGRRLTLFLDHTASCWYTQLSGHP